jgi:23S rRNA (uracil1939-C5)-methyltransferase
LNLALRQLLAESAFPRIAAITSELELLLNPTSARVVCLFHLSRKPRPADLKQAAILAQQIPAIERIELHGHDFLPLSSPKNDGRKEKLQLILPPFPGHTDQAIALSWEAGGFCQVNLAQNIQLIQIVLDFCQVGPATDVLDLFCGMGNFSIPLAMHSATLLGIEGQGSAIRMARENAKQAGLTNAAFEKSPLHPRCQSLLAEGRSFDCVVIDPPRQGAPGLAPILAKLTRKRLVYISCDPATLCRDLGELTSAGFTLKKLQPVDMFPQTHHIETVALLENSGK